MRTCQIWPKLFSMGGPITRGRIEQPTPIASKQVVWMGDSRRVLKSFPEEVREQIGVALYFAQLGEKHADAKPLKGFGDAQVLEIVENHDGEAYRAVYTVRIQKSVYVLHVFQKKSKKEDKTPQHDVDLIRDRLKRAIQQHNQS